MAAKVEKIKIDRVFKVCPSCGYKNGFHSMYERIGKGKQFSWKLICPQCEKIYDVGLKVRIEGQ